MMKDKRLAKPKPGKVKIPTSRKRAVFFWLLTILFTFGVYGYFSAYPIDVTNGDIGRHLKNGELFVRNHVIPSTNLYSYTHTDRPFINHHWGSGVIFYLIEQTAGFAGLSIFFIVVSLLTLLIFLNLATKHSSFALAAPITICIIPLLMTRRVIRPELFSYFLSGLFLHALWTYKYRRGGIRWLLGLPVLMIGWVNLHIYFFIGIMLIGVIFAEALAEFFFQRTHNSVIQIRDLSAIMVFSLLATCLNPAGISGALYPFLILREFEFPVMEGYSALALMASGFEFLPLIYFQIVFGLLCLSWLYVLLYDRPSITTSNGLLTVIFSSMAWVAVRNFPLFAYFTLPLIAANLKSLAFLRKTVGSSMTRTFAIVLLTSAVLVLISPKYFLGSGRGPVGIGLKEANHAASQFFLSENLQGPIFNNFDVGGYLIYHLFPKHKVFVDNRPEAYPASFFTDVYFPLLQHEANWPDLSNKFGFNLIVFNHRDRSTWSEDFIVRRVLDPLWAPVFFDEDIIIFVKRYGSNHLTVRKFELPRDRILTSSN
jgi:hypothetical protein